jgi:hypothetical protein
MKAQCKRFLSALALFSALPAAAQTVGYGIWHGGGPVGSILFQATLLPAGSQLSANSSNPWVAAVGRFQAGTLAQNAASILNSICPADRAGYADLVQTPDDLLLGAEFLAPLTTRDAIAVAHVGQYNIVFATLSGSGIPPFPRHYVVKTVNGSPCLTLDLMSNNAYNTLITLIGAAYPFNQ